MQKSKRPSPKKAVASAEGQDDALTQSLYELAISLSEQEGRVLMNDALKKKENDFQKILRKCLLQKKDEALFEALERTQYDDGNAFQYLKENIEEASEIIVFRRAEGQDLEVNAFVIPLFARTTGGLHSEQCFLDEEAFDLLRKSIIDARLESQDASVVLVSHAYHVDEIDRIRYSQLNEMLREAFDSMTGKKTAATAISRSISGWPENHFEPQDPAVELRFLLGFTLKRMDDPFYLVPENEAAADRYFDARAVRFQHWAQQVVPLVQRCLVTDGSEIEINFLYQDLFHGGKERGIAEYYMLQMMSDLHHDLQEHDILPEHTTAVIGPTDSAGEMVLRVNLYAADGNLVASSEKPISVVRDLQVEADDVHDALTTLGVQSLALALKFDADGQAIDVRPYEN